MRRGGATLCDLVIVLCVLMVLGGGTIPLIVCRSRETANRVKCASCLKQVGLAILLYSNDNSGAYPRTTHDPTTPATTEFTGWQSPSPFAPGGPAANDVTAALFLLLRTQDITSDVFICPTQRGVTAWDFGGLAKTAVSNFPHRGVLSYGYTNPYPTDEAAKKGYVLTNSITAEFAVAADMSPGGPVLATLTPLDSARKMRAGNSRNHDAEGQNVLFGDGHVEFLQNPFVGVQRDNIFTAAGGPVLPGHAYPTSPIDGNDSVILPTALAGPVPPTPPWYTWSWVWMIGLVLLIALVVARAVPRGSQRPSVPPA